MKTKILFAVLSAAVLLLTGTGYAHANGVDDEETISCERDQSSDNADRLALDTDLLGGLLGDDDDDDDGEDEKLLDLGSASHDSDDERLTCTTD